MKKINLLKSMFLAAVCCGVMSVNAQNLVVNPGFELTENVAAPWQWHNGSSFTTTVASSVTASSSDGVLTITNPTATTRLIQQVQLVAGKTYTVSFNYTASAEKFRIWSGFAPTPGSSSGIVFLTANATDDPMRTNNGYFPVAETPTLVSIDFTVPATPSLMQLEFRYYTQSGGTFTLSDVSVVEKTDASIGDAVADKGIIIDEAFYNVLGVKVAEPIPGQVYIKKTTYDSGLVETIKSILF